MKQSSFIAGLIAVAGIGCSVAGAAVLRVDVTEDGTSVPVKAVVVAVGPFPRIISAVTDESGTAMLDLPTLSNVSIAVRSDTHGTKCVDTGEVAKGAVSVRMVPSIRVYGVVSGASGDAVAGAEIRIDYRDSSHCRVNFEVGGAFARTNERGEYVLRNVDLERDPVIRFLHPSLESLALGKEAFVAADRIRRKKELNIRLDAR